MDISMIDLVELRKEIKEKKYISYVHRNNVYLEDAENGETILICNLDEVDIIDAKVF